MLSHTVPSQLRAHSRSESCIKEAQFEMLGDQYLWCVKTILVTNILRNIRFVTGRTDLSTTEYNHPIVTQDTASKFSHILDALTGTCWDRVMLSCLR